MLIPVVAVSLLASITAIGVWGAPWWIGVLWVCAASPAFVGPSRRRQTVLLVAALVAALAGGWRFNDWQHRDVPTLMAFVGTSVTLEGTIGSPPDAGLTTTRYKFDATSIVEGSVRRRVKRSLLLTMSQFAQFELGARVLVTAELDEPPTFDGFDYRSYLARQDIVALAYFPRVELISPPPRWSFRHIADVLRTKLEQSLSRSLHEPDASLAAGLVLGREGGLSDDRLEEIRSAGIAHLVAVSGAHLALLVAGTALVTRSFLSRRASLTIGAISVLPYVLVAGAEPNIMRAFVMALVMLAAFYIERPHLGLHVLALAAVGLLLWRPAWAVDVGFQLSISATAGIIAFHPWLGLSLDTACRRIRLTPAVPGPALDVLAVSAAAWVSTLPVIWVTFGRISLVGVKNGTEAAPTRRLRGAAAPDEPSLRYSLARLGTIRAGARPCAERLVGGCARELRECLYPPDGRH